MLQNIDNFKLPCLSSARRLIKLNICAKFNDNISNAFQVSSISFKGVKQKMYYLSTLLIQLSLVIPDSQVVKVQSLKLKDTRLNLPSSFFVTFIRHLLLPFYYCYNVHLFLLFFVDFLLILNLLFHSFLAIYTVVQLTPVAFTVRLIYESFCLSYSF